MAPEQQSLPWPHWMLRHMVADDAESLEDLIWSVGGSPPWGGVSSKEADAVFKLVEAFRGPGRAPEARYEAVRAVVKTNEERTRALDLFRYFDEIVSNPESYPATAVERGLALAERAKHAGVQGLFRLFEAGIAIREGRYAQARSLTLAGLELLLSAADGEPIYAGRVAVAAQNAVSLAVNEGNLKEARSLLDRLSEILPADFVAQMNRKLR